MMTLIKPFERLRVPLAAIKSATNNFAEDNYVGRGGFGKVYKGELVFPLEQTMVAVKRLDPAFGQGNSEFWKEIMMLSLYRHKNIVSLLGFCDEGGEKILVYEYVPKRSLDLYVNDNDLTWIRRLRICIGAASGLAYLHSPIGNQQRVLHRDIKSSNILLDENWNAKISDFGLSKFGPANQKYTFLVSNAVGTIGYCDPLYIETGFLTKESDVYSFGVVLFEVLCGRLCIDNKLGKCPPLIGLVRQYYEENKMEEIIYDNIKDEINPRCLEEFTTTAYQCLKRDLKERPLMIDVVRRLETAIECQLNMLAVDVDKSVSPPPESSLWFSVDQEPPVAFTMVEIIEASNMNGLPDPYVRGQLGAYRFRTKTQKKTSSPRWLEEFKIPIASWDSPNDLLVEVWAAKKLFKDNMLGVCSVVINDINDGQRHDMWLPLHINAGRMHLAITVLSIC